MDHADPYTGNASVWNATSNISSTTPAALHGTTDVLIEETIAKWVSIVFPPGIFLFGVVGNMLTVVVLSRGNWNRGTMPIYLTTLSVTDTSLLIVGLLRLWLIATFQLDIRNISNLACKTLAFTTHVLIYFSSWIVVSITTERTIAIAFPLGWKCTRTKAKLTLFCLGIFFSGISGHILYGYSLTERGQCSFEYTPAYTYFYTRIFSSINLVVTSVAPSSVLVATNAIVIWQIRRSKRNLSEFESSTQINRMETTGSPSGSSSEPTKMLIALSAAYLVTTLPVHITIVVHNSLPQHVDRVSKANFLLAYNITMILMYCNNAVNFYLYCFSGSNFRRQLLRLIPRRGVDQRAGSSRVTRSNQLTELSIVEHQHAV